MSPRRLPHPYRTDEFVNRTRELDLVVERIQQACNGKAIASPILHFYGTPRIGETWLLGHLACTASALLLPSSSRLAVVLADCGAAAKAKDIRSWLFNTCKKQCIGSISAWQEVLADVKDLPGLTQTLKKLLDANDVLLLLFDQASVLSEMSFELIENEFFWPLVETEHAVIVVAGKKYRPAWRNFMLNRRVHYHLLQAFGTSTRFESMADTSLQLRNLGFHGSVIDVYRYTFGHPWASRLVAEALNAGAADPFNEQIEMVEAEILRDVPAHRWQVVRAAAVLRFPLKREWWRRVLGVVSDLGDLDSSLASEEFFLDELGGIQDALDGEKPNEGRLHPEIQNVLLRRLRFVDPRLYKYSHEAAFLFYTDSVDSDPSQCGPRLAEAVYHWAAQENTSKQVLLHQLLAKSIRTGDIADELLKKMDADKELHELISKPVYDALVRYVHDLADQLPTA